MGEKCRARSDTSRTGASEGRGVLSGGDRLYQVPVPSENEQLVRTFYESTVPGHRERLRAIQAPHVVYDMPEGMPVVSGRFEGLDDVLERFLTGFYGALDVRFVAQEFVAQGETVVAIGRIQGKTRKTSVPVDVPFVHVWTVRDGYLQRMRAFTDTAVLARALIAPI
jgi:ketosteroid isomerase-like protein